MDKIFLKNLALELIEQGVCPSQGYALLAIFLILSSMLSVTVLVLGFSPYLRAPIR